MSEEEIGFSDFIASTIHDMKNSLNMQIGALDKIALKCREKGDTETFLQLGQMIYEANRMNGNLIQLLSLYKLGKSIYPVDISEHCVYETIEEALLHDQSIMEIRGIEITVECEPDLIWYYDRDLLSGVLINALNNAYKYTKDKIRISAGQKDGNLELRVEDNGNGYPPHMLNDNAASDKSVSFSTGSTGLGFYFSHRVAQLHKNAGKIGSLTIENGGKFGGGCFVVRLP